MSTQTHEQRTGSNEEREVLHYSDGSILIKFAGRPGSELDFGKHKYNPGSLWGEALVKTSSGNSYLIRTDQGATLVANVRASREDGKLVAAYTINYPVQFPPIRFHERWEVPGFTSTTPVTEVFLKTKWAHPSQDIGYRKIDTPNPIDEAKAELVPYGYTDHFGQLLGVGPPEDSERPGSRRSSAPPKTDLPPFQG